MTNENTTYDDMKEAFTEHTGLVLDHDPSEDVPLEGVKIISARTESGKPVSPEPVTDDEPVAREPEKAPDTEPTAVEASADVEVKDEPSAWDHTRPPSSWTPKAREDWKLIPEHLQKEITRREENAANGARNMHTTYAPAKAMMDTLHPYFDEVVSMGVNPVDHVGALLATEKTLRTADMPAKFQALLAMADQFGVPLREIVNESVGMEVVKAPVQQQAAVPDEIRQELAEIRAWREQQESATVISEVGQFGAENEFFHDVRDSMADLIEKGLAQDLQSAYDMAIWGNPEIREVLISRTTQKANPIADRQAKAAKASVKSSGAISVEMDDESDSIADTLRKAFNLSSGRV